MYCLIAMMLRFQLPNKKKGPQQGSFHFPNNIMLNQFCVYNESVYADNVVRNFWFVRSFSSQQHSKVILSIASEIVCQLRTKECKTKSFFCNVNLNFLRSSRHFNCDTVFAVIVSCLNECVHNFINACNRRLKTGSR